MIVLQWNMMMNKIEDINYHKRRSMLLHITTKTNKILWQLSTEDQKLTNKTIQVMMLSQC